MNITFIIYSMSNGGAERVVANLSNYFCSIGHNVNILMQTNETSFYTLDKRVKLTTIIEKDECSGIKGYLRRSWAIRKFLKTSETDLAISFMTSSNITLSIASLGLECRSFGSERTYPPLHNLPEKLNILRKIFYRFLDGVVVQTTDTKDWFNNNITTKSLEIIPNPINCPFQDTHPTVEVPLRSNGRKSIISVGRLVASKGHSEMIKSFHRYQDALKDSDLYILGGGEEYDNLNDLVLELGLEGRVFIVGQVGNMSDWYNFADVFVMASRYEGFPNVLLEAMSFGLPAIAMNCHSGPKDIIDGTNGILIELDDYDGLWCATSRIMKDRDEYSSISKNARKVMQEYNIEALASRWLLLKGCS